MKSPVVKRSIVIAGHKTSVSLEDAFWASLKEIAGHRDITLSDMVASIDTGRSAGQPRDDRHCTRLSEWQRKALCQRHERPGDKQHDRRNVSGQEQGRLYGGGGPRDRGGDQQHTLERNATTDPTGDNRPGYEPGGHQTEIKTVLCRGSMQRVFHQHCRRCREHHESAGATRGLGNQGTKPGL